MKQTAWRLCTVRMMSYCLGTTVGWRVPIWRRLLQLQLAIRVDADFALVLPKRGAEAVYGQWILGKLEGYSAAAVKEALLTVEQAIRHASCDWLDR